MNTSYAKGPRIVLICLAIVGVVAIAGGLIFVLTTDSGATWAQSFVGDSALAVEHIEKQPNIPSHDYTMPSRNALIGKD